MDVLTIYTDGGVSTSGNKTSQPCYCSFVAYIDGIYRASFSKVTFGTSNEAEYIALHLSIHYIPEIIGDLPVTQVSFISDSKLMVCQMQDIWKVKANNMKRLVPACKEKIANNISVPTTFSHVPREQNKMTDAFCNLAKQGIIKSNLFQSLEDFSTLNKLSKNKVFKKYVKKED